MADSFFSGVRTDSIYRPDESSHSSPPSKLKTYRFVIVIILSLGGLAAGAAGVAAYAGALSTIAQVDAIIMMGVGGGSGVILFVIGIVGTVKDCQAINHPSRSTQKIGATSSLDTKDRLVYGPDAWPELGEKWKCELQILDKIPEAPKEAVAPGRVRIYIPEKVSVNGKPQAFTLNNLIEMSNGLITKCTPSVKEQFGNHTASGWIEIDRELQPGSRGESYDFQKKMVERMNCHMPNVLVAVVSNLMVFAFTGKPLHGVEPRIYDCTRCLERVESPGDKYPIVVGWSYDSRGLEICGHPMSSSDEARNQSHGVAAYQKF